MPPAEAVAECVHTDRTVGSYRYADAPFVPCPCSALFRRNQVGAVATFCFCRAADSRLSPTTSNPAALWQTNACTANLVRTVCPLTPRAILPHRQRRDRVRQIWKTDCADRRAKVQYRQRQLRRQGSQNAVNHCPDRVLFDPDAEPRYECGEGAKPDPSHA